MTWHEGFFGGFHRGVVPPHWAESDDGVSTPVGPTVAAAAARVPASPLDEPNAAFHLARRSEVRAGNDVTLELKWLQLPSWPCSLLLSLAIVSTAAHSSHTLHTQKTSNLGMGR